MRWLKYTNYRWDCLVSRSPAVSFSEWKDMEARSGSLRARDQDASDYLDRVAVAGIPRMVAEHLSSGGVEAFLVGLAETGGFTEPNSIFSVDLPGPEHETEVVFWSAYPGQGEPDTALMSPDEFITYLGKLAEFSQHDKAKMRKLVGNIAERLRDNGGHALVLQEAGFSPLACRVGALVLDAGLARVMTEILEGREEGYCDDNGYLGFHVNEGDEPSGIQLFDDYVNLTEVLDAGKALDFFNQLSALSAPEDQMDEVLETMLAGKIAERS